MAITYDHLWDNGKGRCKRCGAQSSETPGPCFTADRFGQWPTSDLSAQCRMQARESLDSEYISFMIAVADRLDGLARMEQMDE